MYWVISPVFSRAGYVHLKNFYEIFGLETFLEYDGVSPADEKTSAWRCRMCGYVHQGEEPPDKCPYCFFSNTAFKKVWPKE